MLYRRALSSLTRLLSGVSVPVFYALFFIGLAGWYLFRWPIVAFDTDLWYHLNAGRYISVHHSLPTDSFFSFISPPRPWVDYYWLFQIAVYKLYRTGDYPALIAFRALAYVATALLIVRFLLDQPVKKAWRPWQMSVAVCCCLILLPRSVLIRPHLITYGMIAAFLWILECRPQKAWWLPLLAVLWCNIHGVSYPILLGISFIYLLKDPPRVPAAPLLASIAAVFLTPHGLKLLPTPFLFTGNTYVRELQPLGLKDLLAIHAHPAGPALQALYSLFAVGVLLTAAAALFNRTGRLRHLLLCFFGFALLLRSNRFWVEFALLSLPLLRSGPVILKAWVTRMPPKPVYWFFAAALMVIPLRLLTGLFDPQPNYPVSSRYLPVGVATFLQQINAQGKVLNYPDSGGYLQWMLYPKYKIFMDMETPFLFKEEDMRLIRDAMAYQSALDALLAAYRPEFISVPIRISQFPQLMKKHGAYAPVFFDDAEVLYTDRRQYPALARDFELKAVDPFELAAGPPKLYFEGDAARKKPPHDRAAAMEELKRILTVYPGCGLANYFAGWVENG